MAKTVKYADVADRFIAERDAKQLVEILIRVLEKRFPGFFEEGVNELYPTASGDPHTAEYTKPV